MAEHASVQGKKQTLWYTRDNPEKGYPSGTNGRQNHHILPCTSVKKSLTQAAQSQDNLIKGVKYFSKWNINKSGNMVMLPTFKVYIKLFGKKGGKQGPIAIPPDVKGRPCHDRGHPKYNDNAQRALLSIWSKVAPQVEEHKLTDATDISGELDDKITDFEDKVNGRSATQANWKAMVDGNAGAQKAFYMAT